MLSVGLVAFTALSVGLLTWWRLPVPFAASIALGAVGRTAGCRRRNGCGSRDRACARGRDVPRGRVVGAGAQRTAIARALPRRVTRWCGRLGYLHHKRGAVPAIALPDDGGTGLLRRQVPRDHRSRTCPVFAAPREVTPKPLWVSRIDARLSPGPEPGTSQRSTLAFAGVGVQGSGHGGRCEARLLVLPGRSPDSLPAWSLAACRSFSALPPLHDWRHCRGPE